MRRLLVPALVGILLTLGGCALSDPLVAGTPDAASSDPQFAAALTTVQPLVRTAEAAVLGALTATPTDAALLAMRDTLAAEAAVLAGPVPLDRLAAAAPPAPPPPSTDEVDPALAGLREAATGAARATTGRAAVFWASLAASAEQMRLGLTLGYASPLPAVPSRTVASMSATDAEDGLIAAYHAAIFDVTAGVGFLTASDPLRTQLATLLADLVAHRDGLVGAAYAAGLTPPTSLGAYALPSGRDPATIRTLVGTAQAALAQAAGVWVAAAPDPAAAISELEFAATCAQPLGVGWARWPGWPDSASG